MTRVVAIVAGEPSGDNLGAGLIYAMQQQDPDLHFIGIGGPKMQAAGCELLFHMDRIGIIGIDGLFSQLSDILSIRKQLKSRFTTDKPAVFVGIDVPDFNIVLEQNLKREGVKIVHYVSPTVWAWRGYRIHRIRRSVDHMLTLFPFEARYYREQKVPVTCVGHPMADEIGTTDQRRARKDLGIDENSKVIALLPGSRRAEIKKLSGLMVDSAVALREHYPDAVFLLPMANDKVTQTLFKLHGDIPDEIILLQGQARLALEAADVAVLASGTASLEAALMKCPHVVVYKLGYVMCLLFKMFRHVTVYSMPNHLLPEPEVPELMQDNATAPNVAEAVRDYLDHPEKMQHIKERFSDIKTTLRRGGSMLAAKVVLTVMNRSENFTDHNKTLKNDD